MASPPDFTVPNYKPRGVVELNGAYPLSWEYFNFVDGQNSDLTGNHTVTPSGMSLLEDDYAGDYLQTAGASSYVETGLAFDNVSSYTTVTTHKITDGFVYSTRTGSSSTAKGIDLLVSGGKVWPRMAGGGGRDNNIQSITMNDPSLWRITIVSYSDATNVIHTTTIDSAGFKQQQIDSVAIGNPAGGQTMRMFRRGTSYSSGAYSMHAVSRDYLEPEDALLLADDVYGLTLKSNAPQQTATTHSYDNETSSLLQSSLSQNYESDLTISSQGTLSSSASVMAVGGVVASSALTISSSLDLLVNRSYELSTSSSLTGSISTSASIVNEYDLATSADINALVNQSLISYTDLSTDSVVVGEVEIEPAGINTEASVSSNVSMSSTYGISVSSQLSLASNFIGDEEEPSIKSFSVSCSVSSSHPISLAVESQKTFTI